MLRAPIARTLIVGTLFLSLWVFLAVSPASAASATTEATGTERLSLVIKGAVAKETTFSVADLKALGTRQIRVKIRDTKGDYQCAWELRGPSLRDVLTPANPTKTAEDGFNRTLDLLIAASGSAKKAAFSYGEIFLNSADDTFVVATDWQFILPHKHPALPAGVDGWQACSAKSPEFLQSCVSCHNGTPQPPISAPIGLVLASIADRNDSRLVQELKTLEVQQVGSFATPIAGKVEKETMWAETPALKALGSACKAFSGLLKDPALTNASFEDDSVGLGKGFHGRHKYDGIDLGQLLQKAIPTADPIRGFLVVTGADGYRSVFSGGELFLGTTPAQILLINQEDQKPLNKGQGRYKAFSRDDFFVDRCIRTVGELVWEELDRPAKQ